MTVPAARLTGISKRFGAVLANDDVSLTVATGTVHGIVGENGAGKSTLMSVLYGLYTADSGHIEVFGQAALIRNAHEAIALGIGMVHQHFMLVDTLSALENVMLGAEPHALLKRAEATARARLAPLIAIHRAGGAAGCQGRRSAGGRSAAAGDPQGAGPWREDPHPGRTHRRAHAAGNRTTVRGASAPGRAGHDDPAHHAQAEGSHAPVRPRHGDARRAGGARDGGGRHVGRSAGHGDGRAQGVHRPQGFHRSRCARARRAAAACAGPGLARCLGRDAAGRHRPVAARGRDRRPGRRLGQRPERAARSLVRPARAAGRPAAFGRRRMRSARLARPACGAAPGPGARAGRPAIARTGDGLRRVGIGRAGLRSAARLLPARLDAPGRHA